MRTLADAGTPGTLPWITPKSNPFTREVDLDFAFGHIWESASDVNRFWHAHVGFRDAPNRRITLEMGSLLHHKATTLEAAVAWAEWELRDEVSAHQRMAIVRAHNAAKEETP